ncbi:hypothetical protein PX52LOC_03494 [Limnoglobus roseus]|uniref:Uncharacterized protein n=1 Tax=Limnoglobus roseus TaxID=2598579 RepID=A0A5C1AD16_9BACT|nr:hypothetical protein PX52LOC_03494 [Limnoglobus roseus]
MPKFEIIVERTLYSSRVLGINAESEEEARDYALYYCDEDVCGPFNEGTEVFNDDDWCYDSEETTTEVVNIADVLEDCE